MTVATFLKALFIISTLTGLITEAVKKQLDELGKKYYSNMLAGIISIAIGIFVFVCYFIFCKWKMTAEILIAFLGLVIMSWVMAMVGYDKVIQTVKQISGV